MEAKSSILGYSSQYFHCFHFFLQTSIKVKLLCTQVTKDLLGDGIDVSVYVYLHNVTSQH